MIELFDYHQMIQWDAVKQFLYVGILYIRSW